MSFFHNKCKLQFIMTNSVNSLKQKGKIMTKFMLELSVGLKNLFREKINIVITLLILILAFNAYSFTKLKKKIDHRYFNTTTTIEELFDVKINTLNGELKH